MNEMRSLSAADIARLLPMPRAIDVAADAFAAISAGRGTYPQRVHIPVREGDALVMPGYDGLSYLGTKIVVVNRSPGAGPGTRACYLLLRVSDAQPVLLCDGTALTALRTGAATGLATRRLARKDASVLALFGVGGQATEQLAAVLAVRPIRDVRVVNRDTARGEKFVDAMASRFPTARFRRTDARTAVASAHVIVTATNATAPLFDGCWLQPGTHVNAIGSFRPEMRELDLELARRGRYVVDQREAALDESGELSDAVAAGIVRVQEIQELGEIAEDGRRTPDEITIFKTVGHAALDLYTATAMLGADGERASE
ncbi:MAG: ornithine cyclodeaminase family protein [Casimicrobiaceae bacterium]